MKIGFVVAGCFSLYHSIFCAHRAVFCVGVSMSLKAIRLTQKQYHKKNAPAIKRDNRRVCVKSTDAEKKRQQVCGQDRNRPRVSFTLVM